MFQVQVLTCTCMGVGWTLPTCAIPVCHPTHQPSSGTVNVPFIGDLVNDNEYANMPDLVELSDDDSDDKDKEKWCRLLFA